MRILVLEDHFALREQLVSLIETMGHSALPVKDAREAIEVLQRTQADAVITDVFVKRNGSLVPEGGVRLVGAIRFSRSLGLKISRKAPVLAISGGLGIAGGYSPLRTARDIGADFCLSKPLKMDEVAVWILDAEISVSERISARS
ncbi:MAG: response regulator [Pseudomonadota bacterium]